MPEEDDDLEQETGEYQAAYHAPAAVQASAVWRQGIADFTSLDVQPTGYWQQIGPGPQMVDAEKDTMGSGPMSGEILDIAVDPSGATDQIIYVATNDGGIWKTTDGGATWKPTMDFMPSLSMGAVAIDPAKSNIIYAGSGNMYDGGSAFSRSAGLYKSIDGGDTWTVADGGYFGTVLSGDNAGIYRIVCPAGDSVLVATQHGLFRSVDGALNFGKNAPAFDDGDPIQTGDISTVFLDSASPSSSAYFVSKGVGIFKLTINADASVTISADLFKTSKVKNFTNIALAQGGPSDSQVLLASVQYEKPQTGGGTKSTYVGLYKSKDGGATWKLQPAATQRARDWGRDQTGYDLTAAIDPQDANRLYIGFQQLWVSRDGGRTFPAPAPTAGVIHYDHHALVFSPPSHRPAGNVTPFLVGEDGGIGRGDPDPTKASGIKFSNLSGNSSNGLATNLFRGIDIGRGSAANNVFTFGGMQDTGTAGHRQGDAGLDWHTGINGDGGRVAVDPAAPQWVYGFDDGVFIRSTDGGATWKMGGRDNVGFGLTSDNSAENQTKRVCLEPSGSDATKRTVYVSEDKLMRVSTDSGVHFKSPAIGKFNDVVTSIAVDPNDSTRIWVGLWDGSVHLSIDSGKTWDASPFVTAPGPTDPVGEVAVDPADGKRAVVSYFGMDSVSAKFSTKRVYLTADSGGTWTDISGTAGSGPKGNLPALPFRSITFMNSTSPSSIVAAGDGGVVTCADVGKPWKILGAGLPVVACTKVSSDFGTHLLRVGTYGRSVFEFTQPSTGFLVAQANLAFDPVATGQSRVLPITLYNCGGADIQITGITLADPSKTDFTLDSPPSFPLAISAHDQKTVNVKFNPTAAGQLTAAFQIATDAPNGPLTVKASGEAFASGKGARLAVNANLGFGEVKSGETYTLPVVITNTGTKDLNILSMQRIDGSSDFDFVPPLPPLPVTIKAGESQTFQVQFKPSGSDAVTAKFEIKSDASRASIVIQASGGTGSSILRTVLIVVGVVVGVVVAVGAGILIYEALNNQKKKK